MDVQLCKPAEAVYKEKKSSMFLDVEKHDQNQIAIRDDSGYSVTYGELCKIIGEFAALNLPRCVVFCFDWVPCLGE